MQNKYALVCGCNYSGSWKVYQSLDDAKRFYAILRYIYNIPSSNIHTLFNTNYTRDNVIKELKWISSKMNNKDDVGIVYVAGHGTQTRDTNGDELDELDELDGMDENWQTYDRKRIVDDEITEIFANNSHPESHLTVISDCCHSGTMLDYIDRENSKYSDRHWVSIGAALDDQSALQSGDGSVCSVHLFDIINQNPEITIGELKKQLKEKMSNSFVGDLQTSVINVSNKKILDCKIFD